MIKVKAKHVKPHKLCVEELKMTDKPEIIAICTRCDLPKCIMNKTGVCKRFMEERARIRGK